jgi:hypothetical protein
VTSSCWAKCERSLFFPFSELIFFSKFINANKLRTRLIPNPTFSNFQKQNPLKNQYLPDLGSENCEISSIKSDSLRAFQQHQEHSQIPIQILVLILFNFHWENHSTIK